MQSKIAEIFYNRIGGFIKTELKSFTITCNYDDTPRIYSFTMVFFKML